MKKVKFMLMSLALIAVLGGALAFKARYVKTFCATNAIQLAAGAYTCIDPTNQRVLTCPVTVNFSTVDTAPGATVIFCSTTVNLQGKCPGSNCFTTPTSITSNQ